MPRNDFGTRPVRLTIDLPGFNLQKSEQQRKRLLEKMQPSTFSTQRAPVEPPINDQPAPQTLRPECVPTLIDPPASAPQVIDGLIVFGTGSPTQTQEPVEFSLKL